MMHRLAPPTRSQLYVPANRADWFEKAVGTGADALILDLEDSVPLDRKAEGRDTAVDYLRGAGSGRTNIVRVNDHETAHFLDDVIAVTEAGATAIAMPKVSGPGDVVALDRLLGSIERRCGREVGDTLIEPLLETPNAIRDAYRIGIASPRVAYLGGITARGGDVERGLGFRWTGDGHETFVLRSRVLIDARAAGVSNPVSGTWTELDDDVGLRAFAVESRDLGYEGLAVIHPSHVAVANEVFSPSEAELARDRELIAVMEAAEAQGAAATRFDGGMVDIAMVKRARRRLSQAESRLP